MLAGLVGKNMSVSVKIWPGLGQKVPRYLDIITDFNILQERKMKWYLRNQTWSMSKESH